DRLGRLPEPLELRKGAAEPLRHPVRDVVVPGDREQRATEPTQERGGPLVLVPASSVGQVAGRHDQLHLDPLEEAGDGALDRGVLAGSCVQVREVENPRGHAGPRYTLRTVAEEPAEIFDDLYLGVRAGG